MSQQIKFEKAQLDRMLAEVGSELSAMLQAERPALAKAAQDDAPAEESEGSSGPAESSPPESADGGGPPPPAEGSAPPAEGSAPPAEASAPPPAEGSAPPAEQPGEIEPAPTVEALQAEYAKLDPEQLKMHYLACKSALMATMGAEPAPPPGGPEGSAPPAPPAASPPPPGGAAPMAMAEMKGKQVHLSDGSGGEMEKGKMSKSEAAELEALKKRVQDQEAQLQQQNDSLLQLAEVVATPIRKSVKGLSDLKFIDRTEAPAEPAKPLNKAQVQDRLKSRIREGKLAKSDRELILQYNAGNVGVDKIQHLLADAK